jgi:hypothetical protein
VGRGLGGVAKRLPHVHHRQANTASLIRSEPRIKLTHTGLRAVLAAKPDGSAANEVADHDAVGVPFSNRDFINANHLRSWPARLSKLRSHVLLIQLLDRVPVELELLGNVLDRGRATAPPHVVSKALGIKRVVGQKLQPLALHFAATPALDSAHLEIEMDAHVAARQVANLPPRAVVEAPVGSPTKTAQRFFERRISVMTRALGVTEDTAKTSLGTKTRESVCVQQAFRFGRSRHREIMPNFRLSSNPAKPILVRLSAIHSLKKYPHSYAKIVFFSFADAWLSY